MPWILQLRYAGERISLPISYLDLSDFKQNQKLTPTPILAKGLNLDSATNTSFGKEASQTTSVIPDETYNLPPGFW
jgi:hypothetical protein